MRVLMLSPDPKVPGGVTSFITMLTEHLRDCDVTWIPVGSRDEANRDPDSGREPFPKKIWRVFSAPFRIAWIARGNRFDVVHLNPSFEEKSLVRDSLILLALRCARCRHVLVYFHGWRVWLEQHIARTLLLKRLLVWLLNGARRIAVLAPEFKQGLERMGVEGGRVVVTRTMFDGTILKTLAGDPAPARRSILFMSRFARKKGIYELLEAFARIANEYDDVQLIMAGSGEEEEGLMARAKLLRLTDQVIFPGYAEGEAKWRLLRECTIFALPTYFAEGMPVALLEAMGAGKPLLTSSAGGIRYVVSPAESGVVLDEVTVENVARGLKALLADPRYCRQAGEYNARVAWQHFEAAVVMEDIRALYRDVAGEG